MLANFPPALPKATIEALVPALGLPDAATAQLAELLPALPDPVPLAYTYEYTSDYWVEPDTGVLIDFAKVDRAIARQAPAHDADDEDEYHESDRGIRKLFAELRELLGPSAVM